MTKFHTSAAFLVASLLSATTSAASIDDASVLFNDVNVFNGLDTRYTPSSMY